MNGYWFISLTQVCSISPSVLLYSTCASVSFTGSEFLLWETMVRIYIMIHWISCSSWWCSSLKDIRRTHINTITHCVLIAFSWFQSVQWWNNLKYWQHLSLLPSLSTSPSSPSPLSFPSLSSIFPLPSPSFTVYLLCLSLQSKAARHLKTFCHCLARRWRWRDSPSTGLSLTTRVSATSCMWDDD